MNKEIPESTLTQHQVRTSDSPGHGELPGPYRLIMRYDDRLGNGYNYFSAKMLTYAMKKDGTRGQVKYVTASPDKIQQRFPQFSSILRWQLWSSQGPLCYFSNTEYWASQGELERARVSARWPEATLEQLMDRNQLEARLPEMLKAFKADMESLGFTY